MFFVLPVAVFGLSMWGAIPLAVVGGTFLFVFLAVIFINIIQNKKPHLLPARLRNWEFLPEWMHSLDPLDRLVRHLVRTLRCCFPCCCKTKKQQAKMKRQCTSVSITPPPSYTSEDVPSPGDLNHHHDTLEQKRFNFDELKIPLEKLAQDQGQTDIENQTELFDLSLNISATDSGYCTQVNSTMVSRVNSTFNLSNTSL